MNKFKMKESLFIIKIVSLRLISLVQNGYLCTSVEIDSTVVVVWPCFLRFEINKCIYFDILFPRQWKKKQMHVLLQRKKTSNRKLQKQSPLFDRMKCHVVEVLFTRRRKKRNREYVGYSSMICREKALKVLDSCYDDDDEKVF